MKQYINWLNRQSIEYSRTYEELFRIILSIGHNLKQKKYIGFDVKVGNPDRLLSTVLSLSLVGWLNLFNIDKTEKYLQNANECIELLLEHQLDDGSWLFPYAFRNNPPHFPYSCENFMTVRPLMFALDFPINHKAEALVAIEKNLRFLEDDIGYHNGIFWYSSADHIEVPNISAMATNIFAQASLIFNDQDYLNMSKNFAEYCIKNQTNDGAYPYFSNQNMVYIPYHALEIWELNEANELLNLVDLEASIKKAISYLHNYLDNNGFRSRIPGRWIKHAILLKTYIWSAKASLLAGDFDKGLVYYTKGLQKFLSPENKYFYLIQEYDFQFFSVQIPKINTQFIRYLASLFEIGTLVLRKWNARNA